MTERKTPAAAAKARTVALIEIAVDLALQESEDLVAEGFTDLCDAEGNLEVIGNPSASVETWIASYQWSFASGHQKSYLCSVALSYLGVVHNTARGVGGYHRLRDKDCRSHLLRPNFSDELRTILKLTIPKP